MNTTLSSEICIIVKGFFPALSLKNVCYSIYYLIVDINYYLVIIYDLFKYS